VSDLPQLNPDLDMRVIANAFALRGRVHIPAVLTAQSAARMQRCLEQETEYHLAVSTAGGNGYDLSPDYIAAQDAAWHKRLLAMVFSSARDGFQVFNETHRLSNDGEPYRDPAHYLASVTAFLNSEPLLEFARVVTGMPDIAYADAQATRYSCGNFLTLHNDVDDKKGSNRRAAYVLNMTTGWRADWGGLLLFVDPKGNVEEGYVPAFNALNLFGVPQSHLVSQVTAFAGRPRYSVTGWLRAR
jgi:SM-20-related protein